MEEQLKNEFLDKCQELGITMVGFAPVDRWKNPPEELPNEFNEWIPEEFWPQSIYSEVKTVIVIGLPVTLPIVETAPSIYYHELYGTVNRLLDDDAYQLANFLTGKGYPSIYLPRDGYGDINVLLKRPLSFFSHKHAAYLAGLGSFGLNNVLLTPEYGPRVRFTSIFTTLELEGSPIIKDDLCTRCLLCQKMCPANAILKAEDASNADSDTRESADSDTMKIPTRPRYFPPPMKKLKCAHRSKKLRKTFNNPCGICIKVCPVGEDREIFNRQDTSIYTQKEGFEKYHRGWNHVKKYGSKK